MRRLRLLLLSLCLSLCLCACESAQAPTPLLEMICLDVGQGSCLLLRTSEGDALIDAGGEESQETLCQRLELLGVKSLSLLILTHPDEDHIGGADGILERFSVGTVWWSGAVSESDSYWRLTEALHRKSLTPVCVGAGSGMTLGALKISVLSPIFDTVLMESNDGSLVLSLVGGDFQALVMGDATRAAEEDLISIYGEAQLKSDVLFVGHHGSERSSGDPFLKVVQPDVAVIGCGVGNAHGCPDGRVLTRLESVGAEIYRTDRDGEIGISLWNEGDVTRYEVVSSKKRK